MDVSNIVYAFLGAFLLGAFPTAYIAARAQGINIFKVGSRQAGATNVWKAVNRKTGFVVFMIDVAKGIATILMARLTFGLEGVWVLLPSMGVILGHWFSPATKFRGGDGVASLGGVVVATFHWYAIPATVVAIAFGVPPLRHKFAHPSLQAGITGWTLLLLAIVFLGPDAQRTENLLLYIGVTLIALAVLLKSVRFHRRNSHQLAGDGDLDLFGDDDELGAEKQDESVPL